MRSTLVAAVALAAMGCSSEESMSGPPPAEPAPPCDGLLVDGVCVTVGLAPDDCAPGFEFRDEGCHPVRPAAACADDELALLGETSCRPVLDCGAGPWPIEVPEDVPLIYVDAASPGGDGTAATPYADLAVAMDAAPAGAAILLAAGDYVADVVDKPVTILGRCPTMVHLSPTAGYTGDFVVRSQGQGSRLSGVTLGEVDVSAIVLAPEVVIDHVIGKGLFVAADQLGPASLELRDSLLVEGAYVGVRGADVSVHHIVSRNRLPTVGLGRISAVASEDGTPGHITVAESLLEDVGTVAIVGGVGSTHVSTTAIAGRSDGTAAGIACFRGPEEAPDAISEVTVEDVTVAPYGLFALGADTCAMSVRRATIADAFPGVHGLALGASDPTTVITAEQLLIDASVSTGVQANAGAALTLSRSLVRRPLPDESGLFGDGVAEVDATLFLHQSRVEAASRSAVAAFGGTLALQGVDLRCNDLPLTVQDNATAAQLLDEGGNLCGCEEEAPCKAVSANLAPPSAPALDGG